MDAPELATDVGVILESYPIAIRDQLLAVRALIFETASELAGVGELQETLKWGEPAYLTKSNSGTTIRLAWKPKQPSQLGLYVNCQTDLIDRFRELAPDSVSFEGNRAMVMRPPFDVPHQFLKACITAALTYHQTTRDRRE